MYAMSVYHTKSLKNKPKKEQNPLSSEHMILSLMLIVSEWEDEVVDSTFYLVKMFQLYFLCAFYTLYEHFSLFW